MQGRHSWRSQPVLGPTVLGPTWRGWAVAGSLAVCLLAGRPLWAQTAQDTPGSQDSRALPVPTLADPNVADPNAPASDAGQGTSSPAGEGGLPQTGEGAPSAEGQTVAAVHDPPSRVARLSLLNGNVSTEAANGNTFVPAEMNGVLTTGDRVYTDPAGGAELEAGQLAVRLGGGTDLTVSALSDTVAQFGLAAGAVHLRSFTLPAETVIELDSPDAAVTVLEPGDVRVDVDVAGHTTTVTVVNGRVQVDSPAGSQILTAGQRVRLHGGDPAAGDTAYTEPLPPAETDLLDSFSGTRDTAYASGTDAASGYLSPDTVGGADLASFGSWDSSNDGPIWYPVVAVGWRPYCFGHWRYIHPWGWTWIGNEPWGFAPFHYGRWALHGGRWGWIPGSPVVRPVYAPALVAFAGGTRFAAAQGYPAGANAGHGGGIAAWFPLGPREPYLPPYAGTTSYRNRVNASNIYNANPAEVRALYHQRAVDVFTAVSPGGSPADRTYSNRLAGTIAVAQSSFVEGRPVAHALLPLSAESLASAPVLGHAPKLPDHPLAVAGPAPALPPTLPRPVIAHGLTSPEAARGATAAAAPSELGGATLFHRIEPPARAGYGAEPRTFGGTDPLGRPGYRPGFGPGSAMGTGMREARPATGTAPRTEAPHAAPARPAPAPSGRPR